MRTNRILLTLFIGLVAATLSVEGWAFGRIGDYFSDAKDYVKDVYNDAKDYANDFTGGTGDMWRNYNDMLDANTKKSDKYFHAKGNYEAANRGPGGKHAAEIISNAREGIQLLKPGKSWEEKWADLKADQEANKWGRNGGDPNKYRPNGLDPKYRK